MCDGIDMRESKVCLGSPRTSGCVCGVKAHVQRWQRRKEVVKGHVSEGLLYWARKVGLFVCFFLRE